MVVLGHDMVEETVLGGKGKLTVMALSVAGMVATAMVPVLDDVTTWIRLMGWR